MLESSALYDILAGHGLDFFAGVPDSLLKDFCAYVTDHTPVERNVITANEGTAVALAAGRYLATGRPAVVYMQNSGLGNTINPLTSLSDPAVYGVPTLLVIGWRGEPGHKDEPQHVKMGGVTRELLDAVEVPWAVLPNDAAAAEAAVAKAVEVMTERQGPYALVVPKGTFAKYALETKVGAPYAMSREEAIGAFTEALPKDALVVSTTGKPSRELFELREARGQGHATDFLCVGSMGHASQIALGVSLSRPDRDVYCLDGDGAMIMHMGGLTTIGTTAGPRFKHVVVNNGAHDSVGGQPTCAFDVEATKIALGSGYKAAWVATTRAELATAMEALAAAEGPALVEVRVKAGARGDLGRPSIAPVDQKIAFMGAAKG